MEHFNLTARAEIKRLGKFGAVGILNTGLDFGLYNLLSSSLGLSLIQANILSTTAAMGFSFVANKKLVFKHHAGSFWRQAAVFLAITAFGLYVIQTGTILLLTDLWVWPVRTAIHLFHWFGLTGHDNFLIKNTAKAIATALSLSWNYVMYKKVVFN